MKTKKNKEQTSSKLKLEKWHVTKITELAAIKGGGPGASGGAGCPTKTQV